MSRHQIRLELADQIWPVRLDPSQTEHALINLVVNARDAMPEGGVLTLATANVPHRSGDAADPSHAGDWVALTVSDTGIGIAPEILPHLFEPFFSTKPVTEGTGLGLSQVDGFVQQSGGRITVRSEPSHGASFRLLFPRASGNRADAAGRRERDGTAPPEDTPAAAGPAHAPRAGTATGR
jgi:signal transduction histidine kinase